jgi:hypothetical protein
MSEETSSRILILLAARSEGIALLGLRVAAAWYSSSLTFSNQSTTLPSSAS